MAIQVSYFIYLIQIIYILKKNLVIMATFDIHIKCYYNFDYYSHIFRSFIFCLNN